MSMPSPMLSPKSRQIWDVRPLLSILLGLWSKTGLNYLLHLAVKLIAAALKSGRKITQRRCSVRRWMWTWLALSWVTSVLQIACQNRLSLCERPQATPFSIGLDVFIPNHRREDMFWQIPDIMTIPNSSITRTLSRRGHTPDPQKSPPAILCQKVPDNALHPLLHHPLNHTTPI